MALQPLETTYNVTLSATLLHYLESDAGLDMGPALRHHTDPRKGLGPDSMESNLLQAMAWIEGVRAESHTYGGFSLQVTIDCDHDTTATRAAVRAAVRTFENAVRNISAARYQVHGTAADGEPSPDGKAAPFYVFDPEVTDTVSQGFPDMKGARIAADIWNLSLQELTLEA